MLGKSQCNLWCLLIKGKNPLSCVQFQLNSSKEHKEKVLSVTKRNGNSNFFWSIVLVQPSYCTCFSQGQSVNKLWKHKGTKKHLFCSMQSLCIPSETTTNPLLLLQTWPAGCYGRIAMGTGLGEALVGMQKTFSVFVWSSCIQLSDFAFEIDRTSVV